MHALLPGQGWPACNIHLHGISPGDREVLAVHATCYPWEIKDGYYCWDRTPPMYSSVILPPPYKILQAHTASMHQEAAINAEREYERDLRRAEDAEILTAHIVDDVPPALALDALVLMRILETPHFAIAPSPDLLAQVPQAERLARQLGGAPVGPADSCRAFGVGGAVQGGRSPSRSDAEGALDGDERPQPGLTAGPTPPSHSHEPGRMQSNPGRFRRSSSVRRYEHARAYAVILYKRTCLAAIRLDSSHPGTTPHGYTVTMAAAGQEKVTTAGFYSPPVILYAALLLGWARWWALGALDLTENTVGLEKLPPPPLALDLVEAWRPHRVELRDPEGVTWHRPDPPPARDDLW